MPVSSKTVWFIVVPRTSMMNVIGPWEVFGHANELLGREAYVLEAMGPVVPAIQTRFGLQLGGLRPLPSRFEEAPHTVVVAGASSAERMPEDHAVIVPWLRRHRARFKRVVSICTGAFALAAAGLLEGRRATTHWMHAKALKARYPGVRVVDEGIYVHDRGVWTSAGVTAGIDLALALVESDHGHALAMAVAKRMVLFLRRSGNQAQFSSALQSQEQEPAPLRGLSTFVFEHMDETLSVERLAGQAGMTSRTFSRWCRKHFDETPAGFVRNLRLREARRLLEETDLPLKVVTARTGLGDQSTLWRVFMQDLGVTPAEYRQRFAGEAG